MSINHSLLLESFTEAVLMLDKDGYITYCNAAATEITGYCQEELLNNSFSILYDNPDQDTTKSDYELGLALLKGTYYSEGWKVKKDQTRYWGEIKFAVVYQNKTLIGFSCQLRDNTENKRREIALRQSEELYRLMIEGVKDYSIFLLDTKGYIQTWNEGAKLMTGYNQNEIIGKHLSTFYTLDDINNKKPEIELKTALEKGKFEEEGWRVKKNGSLFWASVVVTSLYNEQNKLIGFSKVTVDLSIRKENEEALRQSEERYRSLVEQVTDYGIFMMDEKGRIVSWNEGAKRIKGYTASDIIGKYFSIFYPEEDILSGKPSLELKIASKEGKYEEEGWRLRKDGTRFWANVVITAVYNSRGNLVGFSKVTRDLTERKAAEQELRNNNAKYRKLAHELKVANTELSYANEELEQFTSIVSHDLQEPIRTIKSFLQLIDLKLSQTQLSDLKGYINKSINAANRMKELINNLLNYTQLSRGEMVKEKVDVLDLFNEAVQNVKSAIDASEAEIIIESDVSTIDGDRVQLGQLVQNLLSNALKFTNASNPRVIIKCTREDGHPKFSITDNGIGIAENDINKVFDIFRRLHTKKEYPGTGIGLAICKKIIDRHNGRIWIDSTLGKGTTFYFTLGEESIITQST